MTKTVTYYDKHVSSRKCIFCSAWIPRGDTRRPPPTWRSSPSRRGWWAARLHRHPRAQQGRISGAFLAFACGPLRGPSTQLRSHALRLAELGVSPSAQRAASLGGSGGQVHAVLEDMETFFREPPEPPEPPEAQGPGGSRGATPSPRVFIYPNTRSTTKPGDIFQVYLAGSAPRAASFPGRVGASLRHVSF